MTAVESYYYDEQLKRYLVQFMAVFADMQVQVGRNAENDPRLITVPVYGASKDRVVASIKAENTQNKLISLPSMSAYMVGIDQAPEMRKGVGQQRRQTFMPNGGLYPNDISVIEQRMPVPYKAQFELTLWASNQDQMNQMLEQILMVFNPQITLQTTDEAFDWTAITQIELTNISNDENMEAGADRRITRQTLTFEIPIYISAPADVHKRFVKDIFLRVGAVSNNATTNAQYIQELDDSGELYELTFSMDDIENIE